MTKRMGWDVTQEIPNRGKDGSRVEITIYRKDSRYSFSVYVVYGGRADHPWMGYSVWHNEEPYLCDSKDDAISSAAKYVKNLVAAHARYREFHAAIMSLLPAKDPQLSLFGE